MTDIKQKNKRVMTVALMVVGGMIALTFLSVPLYRLTCSVTGWGGTTQRVAQNTSKAAERVMTVQFDTSVARDMPWEFKPDIREVKVKIGQDAIVSFSAENKAKTTVSGTAVFNVTPLKVGKYFYKTQCFCFDEQHLEPGQKVHMPVTFFIDPSIMDDRNMDDVNTITLSYTFFRHKSKELEEAKQKFYTDQNKEATVN